MTHVNSNRMNPLLTPGLGGVDVMTAIKGKINYDKSGKAVSITHVTLPPGVTISAKAVKTADGKNAVQVSITQTFPQAANLAQAGAVRHNPNQRQYVGGAALNQSNENLIERIGTKVADDLYRMLRQHFPNMSNEQLNRVNEHCGRLYQKVHADLSSLIAKYGNKPISSDDVNKFYKYAQMLENAERTRFDLEEEANPAGAANSPQANAPANPQVNAPANPQANAPGNPPLATGTTSNPNTVVVTPVNADKPGIDAQNSRDKQIEKLREGLRKLENPMGNIFDMFTAAIEAEGNHIAAEPKSASTDGDPSVQTTLINTNSPDVSPDYDTVAASSEDSGSSEPTATSPGEKTTSKQTASQITDDKEPVVDEFSEPLSIPSISDALSTAAPKDTKESAANQQLEPESQEDVSKLDNMPELDRLLAGKPMRKPLETSSNKPRSPSGNSSFDAIDALLAGEANRTS
jgi:hypothetical protein